MIIRGRWLSLTLPKPRLRNRGSHTTLATRMPVRSRSKDQRHHERSQALLGNLPHCRLLIWPRPRNPLSCISGKSFQVAKKWHFVKLSIDDIHSCSRQKVIRCDLERRLDLRLWDTLSVSLLKTLISRFHLHARQSNPSWTPCFHLSRQKP